MIHFDLPAVEVDLDECLSRGFEIIGKKVGRIPIGPAVRRFVRLRSDDNQPQRSFATAAPPEHTAHLFVTDGAKLASVEDAGLAPGDGVILTDLLGSEAIRAVRPTALW